MMDCVYSEGYLDTDFTLLVVTIVPTGCCVVVAPPPPPLSGL